MDDDRRKYYFEKSDNQRYSNPRKNNHTVPHSTIDRGTYSRNSKYPKQQQPQPQQQQQQQQQQANSFSIRHVPTDSVKQSMKSLYPNNIAVLSKLRKLHLSEDEEEEDEDVDVEDDDRERFFVEDDELTTEDIGIESSDKDEEDDEVEEEDDFRSGLHNNQERIRYLLRNNNQKFSEKYGNVGIRSHYQVPTVKNSQQTPPAMEAPKRYHRYPRYNPTNRATFESYDEEIGASGTSSRFKKPNSLTRSRHEDRLIDSLNYRQASSNRRRSHKMEDMTGLGDGKGECLRCGGNKFAQFVKKNNPRHKAPSSYKEEEDKEISDGHSYPRHKYYFDKIPEIIRKSQSRRSRGVKSTEDDLAVINDEIPHEYSRKSRQSFEEKPRSSAQSMQERQIHKTH